MRGNHCGHTRVTCQCALGIRGLLAHIHRMVATCGGVAHHTGFLRPMSEAIGFISIAVLEQVRVADKGVTRVAIRAVKRTILPIQF